jgi:hypothetical protein
MLMSLNCSLEMSLPFGPTIFTIGKNRRKKWRPGIVCYGMCCMRYEKPPVTMEPCKLVHWTCPTQMGNKVCNKQNVLMVCSTCLQVSPPFIKLLVDHNPAKLFSDQFAVKGILKNPDGTWIEDKDWLRLNRPIYDASNQITALTEKQADEQLYLYQQAARLVELREKTARTMCGIVTWNEVCRPYDPPMPIQAEAPGEYLEPYMMNCKYKPDTEVSREQKRAIAELFVPRCKKYETAYMTQKREVNVIVGPVFAEHALLHSTVNRPTRACSEYNKLCQLDAKNWWAVFGEQDLV